MRGVQGAVQLLESLALQAEVGKCRSDHRDFQLLKET
jgi:hypothetical protein